MIRCGFRRYIGITQWDDETHEPSVIVASSPHKIRRKAVNLLVIPDPAIGARTLNLPERETVPGFLTDTPLPDLEDIDALEFWYDELNTALGHRLLTICGPHVDVITVQRQFHRACEATST